MDARIVGEGSLNLHDVATIIKKSTSFAVLLKKWKSWAQNIGINESEIPGIEWKVNHETLELKDVPREVLTIWKADKGSQATLKMLCDGLKESGVQDIADALIKAFGQPEPMFMLHDQVYTLEKLVGDSGSKVYQNIYKRMKFPSSNKPSSLIKAEILMEDLPEYYISRTFLSRTQLDEKIFKDRSTKDHIFVVLGVQKSELARVVGFQVIERSGNQLDRITTRFIILEHEDDFEKICKNAVNPLHMVQYNDGQFFWIRSTQSLQVIRTFLKETGEHFSEEDFVSKITSLQTHISCALSISDSPGMGKTLVLKNLAAKLTGFSSNAIVIFIVLQEFVTQTPLLRHSSTLESILSFASENHTKKSILQEMLRNNAFQLFVFLDGYDEVLQDKLHLVDSFLQQLGEIKNIRVIVTTRPHLRSKLEDLLNSFSFEILPFDETNQINFLANYWTAKHGAQEGESLKEFARKCLNELQKIMTDTEKSIAGIPLQCMMLAEVHAAQAIRASKLEQIPEDAVQILSFFQMYKALIDLKLSKISDPLAWQKYLDAHIYESIALLFPDWLEKVKPYLARRDAIDENTLYLIGLLEKIPSSNESRFVHRTFAEYVFADFITRNLKRSVVFVDFLFTQILGQTGVTLEERTNYEGVPIQPSLFKLKHPVIAYFLDMSLQERYCSGDFRQFLITMDLQNITEEDACIAANACCCNGLESCFDLTTNIISQCLSISDKVELKEKYFKHLLHHVIENTNNDSFVRNVLNFTKSELGINLTNQVFEGKYVFSYGLEIPNCTPLHVAIYWGKYNIVAYLLQEYGEDGISIKHLLHVCVYNSYQNSETVIENKLSIIEVLVQLKKEWLEEELDERRPLLQLGVHVKILKKLVDLGANINAHSNKYGTVLHTIQADRDMNSENSFSNMVCWAFNNGFELVHHKSARGVTLLMQAIKINGELDDETLRMLKKASVDFNAQDENGDSVLFYGVRYSKSLQFIQKILDHGANLHHINRKGMNAAHMVMIPGYKLVNYQALDQLKILKSRGFNGWDQVDHYGCTPLMLGIENRIIENNELLQFLHEQGVDYNAHDNDGYSVLFKIVKNPMIST